MRLFLFCFLPLWVWAADGVYQAPNTQIRLLSTEISLPAEGIWRLEQDLDGLAEAYLIPPPLITALQTQSIDQIEQQFNRQKRQGQYKIRLLYYALESYARQHQGRAPARLSDVVSLAQYEGQFFLIPEQTILQKTDQGWQKIADRPLVIELKPLLAGHYWVLQTDRQTRYLPIDADLIKRYRLHIRAQYERHPRQAWQDYQQQPATYRLIARLRQEIPKQVNLSLYNPVLNQYLNQQWQPQPTAGSEEILQLWLEQRLQSWPDQAVPMLKAWRQIIARQYGLESKHKQAPVRRNPNLLDLLSGQAAMEETLQLRSLAAQAQEAASIDIHRLPQLEIPKLPFDRLLKGRQPSKTIALAQHVPEDHFFIWFADGQALQDYWSLASRIWQRQALWNPSAQKADLKTYYLKKLGLQPQWVNRLLPHLGEIAIVLPDLELNQGTEISLIIQLKQAALIKGILSTFGIQFNQPIIQVGPAYWRLKGDDLFISSSRAELDQLLQPTSPLADTAEFQYALLEQPLTDKTRLWIYFSDAFIRHLTSAPYKIAQLRRNLARQEMQTVLAAHWLFKLDQDRFADSLDELLRLGYIQALQYVPDLELKNNRLYSAHWGSLAHMRSIQSQLPIYKVSPSEQQAYRNYLRQYQRYWQRYFDPIAIRIEQEQEVISIDVHILPLVMNSIYRQLRLFLNGQGIAKLQLAPPPILQIAFSLPENFRPRSQLHEIFNYFGLPPAASNLIGSEIRIAIADNYPILSFSRDFVGLNSGRLDDLEWPLLGGLLTRPIAVLIGIEQPQKVKKLLQGLKSQTIKKDYQLNWHQVGDHWLAQWSLAGVANIYFQLSVEGDYLIISNQLNYHPHIQKQETSPAQIHLSLNPAAMQQQSKPLFYSAASSYQQRLFKDFAQLYPYLINGLNLEQSLERLKQEQGIVLQPLRSDQWTEGPNSLLFGQPQKPHLPAYQPELARQLSLFGKIQSLNLSAQLDSNGLKAQIKIKQEVPHELQKNE